MAKTMARPPGVAPEPAENQLGAGVVDLIHKRKEHTEEEMNALKVGIVQHQAYLNYLNYG